MSSQFAPETADGWACLHQFFQVDFAALNALPDEERNNILAATTEFIQSREEYSSESGQTAAFHMLGHKGNFALLHFRKTFEECGQTEIEFARLPIAPYLRYQDSYTSVVELGMYHTTKKVVEGLLEENIKPHSPEWTEQYNAKLDPHKENLHERCYTEIPARKYFCFYPMDKARGDKHNWYADPLTKRAELMMEHGMTGRRFAGKVKQIIGGSIGFDDWEWCVSLFANNPLDIKRLVYEMRFDDATSYYGKFGRFLFGVRLLGKDLGAYFNGNLEVTEFKDPEPAARPHH